MTLPSGIYCPIVTFFQPTKEQDLDIETHVRHVQFLGKAGVEGVVVQGSTAEAVALSPEERKIVSISRQKIARLKMELIRGSWSRRQNRL